MKILEVQFLDQTERTIVCVVTFQERLGFFRKKRVFKEVFFLACTLGRDNKYLYGHVPINLNTGEDAGIELYEEMQSKMKEAHQDYISKI